jgi:transposase
MIPTPGQPSKYDGLGAVNSHTGATVVPFRRRKRRRGVAARLQTLVDKHPTGTLEIAWDNADPHDEGEVAAAVRAAAGRLVLLSLPTYSPWLNPLELWWRHFRREVTHCELVVSVAALLCAARDVFDRYHRDPQHVRSLIGSHAA